MSTTTPDVHLCSDIHFGAENREFIASFLAQVDASDSEHRVVVIPGDLVQKGKKREFAEARAFIHDLHDRGVHVVLTPGNHDLGRWKAELLPWPLPHPRVRHRFKTLWKEHLHRSRGGSLVAARDMDAIHRVGDHVFVALRSVHKGSWLKSSKRIKSDQIKWARKTLKKHKLRDLHLHLVTHRSLWGGHHGAMRQRERLGEKLLRREGFVTLIHGHNHETRFREQRKLPKVKARIDHLSVPSLTLERDGQAGCGRWTPGSPPSFTNWGSRKRA